MDSEITGMAGMEDLETMDYSRSHRTDSEITDISHLVDVTDEDSSTSHRATPESWIRSHCTCCSERVVDDTLRGAHFIMTSRFINMSHEQKPT